jgi:hypothetical protein
MITTFDNALGEPNTAQQLALQSALNVGVAPLSPIGH